MTIVEGTVTVADAVVKYERYAPDLDVEVILVHGFTAHGGWWKPAAEDLARTHGVVSMEFSGHGDSGRRSTYSLALWAQEIAAVIAATCPDRPPVLVGHSIGGIVAALAVSRGVVDCRHLILIDAAVRPPRQTPTSAQLRPPKRVSHFDSIEEAVSRFRLIPPDDVGEQTLRSLAVRAVREEGSGWTWKTDPRVYGVFEKGAMEGILDGIEVDLTLMRGEHSELVDDDIGDYVSTLLGRQVGQIDVAGAGHHLVLEHGRDVAAAIRDRCDARSVS